MSERKDDDILAALLVGAAAGAITALLFTRTGVRQVRRLTRTKQKVGS